ncbi:2Fe-2S iron-sulfur cluster-binding protein [Bradyrhizobium sp. LHD-71]|uniref:2Fe-2S iron-sulfur cluster-binding protein n=1 Tax=Bradyrhizobium sp. LHD-71 TaxID=3072141 RepID=UPI0028104B48|nr:2Fe-2S iron-sulfur cluster-binding protein [Bradyrhizobium sp. LHD-71]MDQ8730053.1 2Fe-2S iron-sulfur cluster-binding protein [Bradyrhizobium sp. LHD-71]
MATDDDRSSLAPSRRAVLEAGGATTLLFAAGIPVQAQQTSVLRAAAVPAPTTAVRLSVNGRDYPLQLDARTTLLDALREHLRLTGSKKGCDHGQCGACTVLVNGRRINACLTLAVMHDGDEIGTVEGLGAEGSLHPIQAAFVTRDAFQCGYCTPGQICSAVGMLREVAAGWPSHATADVATERVALSDEEIRERMSGNICRCSAYPQIVAAIRDAAGGTGL